VAHRVFRTFPTHDELADRIESFVAYLARGEHGRALSLCPIENLAAYEYENEELELAVAERCLSAARGGVARWVSVLGRLDRASVTLTRGDGEVIVHGVFRSRVPPIVARFVMTESRAEATHLGPSLPSGRWSMWFVGFAG